MSDSEHFVIGTAVACTDGGCGRLTRVVIDPVRKALTHLVVEPGFTGAAGRLVPIELVTATTDEIRLQCTRAQFEELEDAEETKFVPGAAGQYGYGQGQILSFPYFGLGGLGLGGPAMTAGGIAGMPQAVTYDKVPLGEVEVQRGEHVQATDGSIGRVRGLVIDPGDYHVTHVLLDEGHLWGKKEVAIPIGAVTGTVDGIQLSLTKDEVRDLPPVQIDSGE
jgi:hypothetical protein